MNQKQKNEIREFLGHDGSAVRVRITKDGEVHKCDNRCGGQWVFAGFAIDVLEEIRWHHVEFGRDV